MTLVDTWLDYLLVERNMATNTVNTYARTLRTFPDADGATREDVEAWWRSRSHLAASSRTNELAAVRAFFRWCVVWEHRDDDPTLRIVAPKVPQGLPRPISRADLATVMAAMPPDLRRAVALGAYGGLRVSEAASLHWSDVDTENRRLLVTGKGSKTRRVGLSPLLLDELLPEAAGYVVTGKATTYSASVLQRKVNRAIRSAGVDATFHQLRHRFGTVALAATGNLLAVSRALGHASPATTAIYAATSDSDLDVIADAACR